MSIGFSKSFVRPSGAGWWVEKGELEQGQTRMNGRKAECALPWGTAK